MFLDVVNSTDLWHFNDKMHLYYYAQPLQAKHHVWKLNFDLSKSIGDALLRMAGIPHVPDENNLRVSLQLTVG